MFQLAALSPAEIRALEDLPPVDKPGMDDYYVPTNNYSPLGQEPDQAAEPDVVGGPETDGAPAPQKTRAFSADQPRASDGKWTSGGGGGGGAGDSDGGGGGSSGGSSGGGGAGPAHTPGSEAHAAREAHREARKVEDYTPTNPDAFATQDRYSTADGSYTPARAAMHDEIVSDALAGVPSSEEPTLYMMGGGPAAGKSSIIKSGDVEHPEAHVMANPDVFKEDLPEYRDGVNAKDIDAAFKAHEESSYLNKAVMSAAAGENKDVVWDGTGDSSIEKLEKQVKVFRDKGYKVQADYVTCDTDAAVSRAAARAEKTGRAVPEKDIRDTHAKVSQIWPEAVSRGLFDRSDLYDTNAGGKPVKIASARGKNLTIHQPEAYQRFLNKANALGGPRDGDGDGKVNEATK